MTLQTTARLSKVQSAQGLISIVFSFGLAASVAAQSFSAKGQLWGSGIFGDDPAEESSSIESQIGYIPTLSLSRQFADDRLLDIEWAYRVSRSYSGEDVLTSREKSYRGWLRYSAPKIEVRFGLQKIAFGPAQFLRPTSWFDTIDLRDPTGQTDAVEAFRLRLFPSSSLEFWSWAINSELDTLSYGGRAELSLASGDWGITYHRDPAEKSQQVGLFPIIMPGPHNRFALDYRYDGLIGLWFEGAALVSQNSDFSGFNRYSMASVGGDFTVPVRNGVLLMTETMTIRGASSEHAETDDQTFTVLMASMPVGLLHQLMAVTQIDWKSERVSNFFRWGITYDYFSINLLFSANPKRVDYDIPESYLPASLAGFGNALSLMIIYNH